MKTTTLSPNQGTFTGVLAALTHGVLNDANAAARTRTAAPSGDRRSLLDRLDAWLWNQELKSVEAFLAQSSDMVDLEQRQRWLERGRA